MSTDRRTALYRHYSNSDELIYVGISKDPYRRTGEHKALSKWFDKVSTIKVEWFETREDALAAEKNAIKKEKPRFNIVHNRNDAIAEEVEEDIHKIIIRGRQTYHGRHSERKLADVAGLNTIRQTSEIIGLSMEKTEALVFRNIIGSIVIGERKVASGKIKHVYMIPYFEIFNFLELITEEDIRDLLSRPIIKKKYKENVV